MATDVSTIVGVVLMSLGTIMVIWGLVLCYTTKVRRLMTLNIILYLSFFQGEYYNADEVQAMVAAEMLEEKKRKKEEEAMFDDIGDIGKKKKKGPLIAD